MWMHWLVGSFVLLAPDSAPPAAPAQSQLSAAHEALADGAAIYLRGLQLVDQDGRSVDLYQDVIASRNVLMHSFFTQCKASCPPTMSTLQALQERLGDRLVSEVRLVSITVNPTHDTPDVLKEYSQRIGAKPGWLFLTGSQMQVSTALQKIGQYVDQPETHMDLLIVGNSRTGLWKKLHGLAPSRELVELTLEVFDDQVD